MKECVYHLVYDRDRGWGLGRLSEERAFSLSQSLTCMRPCWPTEMGLEPRSSD